MTLVDRSRRSFLKASAALAGTTPLFAGLQQAKSNQARGPLIAYVGTFSSPLGDVLPTQVDLPPGNGRGIHLFQVNRASGAMTPEGIHEMGTSPSCLALSVSGTRLYSANETDRVGEDKEGTVSVFSTDRTDGHLTLLNTVRSGGAGPTYVSIHDSSFSRWEICLCRQSVARQHWDIFRWPKRRPHVQRGRMDKRRLSPQLQL